MRRFCQTLKVHPSGCYAWLTEPQSARAQEDQRLLGLIKHAWLEIGGVYGYRKIYDDLRELGRRALAEGVDVYYILTGIRVYYHDANVSEMRKQLLLEFSHVPDTCK